MPDGAVEKVYAYVTRQVDGGRELLVFEQPAKPSAGLQVPKGGVERGESPEEAVEREVQEEAGLRGFQTVTHLISDRWRKPDGTRFARHFFHLTVREPRDGWSHVVTGDGEDAGETYEYFWTTLPPERRLDRDMGEHLPLLRP